MAENTQVNANKQAMGTVATPVNGQATTIDAEIAKLRAELAEAKAKLQAASTRTIVIKQSEKGAVSLYGLGKFPVTLYAEQWEKVLNMGEDIRAFIVTNKATLSTKEKK